AMRSRWRGWPRSTVCRIPPTRCRRAGWGRSGAPGLAGVVLVLERPGRRHDRHRRRQHRLRVFVGGSDQRLFLGGFRRLFRSRFRRGGHRQLLLRLLRRRRLGDGDGRQLGHDVLTRLREQVGARLGADRRFGGGFRRQFERRRDRLDRNQARLHRHGGFGRRRGEHGRQRLVDRHRRFGGCLAGDRGHRRCRFGGDSGDLRLLRRRHDDGRFHRRGRDRLAGRRVRRPRGGRGAGRMHRLGGRRSRGHRRGRVHRLDVIEIGFHRGHRRGCAHRLTGGAVPVTEIGFLVVHGVFGLARGQGLVARLERAGRGLATATAATATATAAATATFTGSGGITGFLARLGVGLHLAGGVLSQGAFLQQRGLVAGGSGSGRGSGLRGLAGGAGLAALLLALLVLQALLLAALGFLLLLLLAALLRFLAAGFVLATLLLAALGLALALRLGLLLGAALAP